MAEDRMLSDEVLLALIKKNSGGGGGTTNYNLLSNKPQIAGTELQGDKSLSDLGIASEDDLAAKQNTLTAGDYVVIENDKISVSKLKQGKLDLYSYEFVTTDASHTPKVKVIKKVNGETISETVYDEFQAASWMTFDNIIRFRYDASDSYKWKYQCLVTSNEHVKDTVISWFWNQTVDYTETFDVGASAITDLVTKGDMTDALTTKQDTLTFDDTPTDNSNNPVKSNGIYDALAEKVDKNNAYIIGLLRNTILPSINQQIVNTTYDEVTSRGVMYVGNVTTIDEVAIQNKAGTITLSDLLNMQNDLDDVSKAKFINPYLESGKFAVYWNNYSPTYANLDNIDVSGFGGVSDTDTNYPSDSDGWGSLVSFCCGGIRLQFYYSWNNSKLYFRSYLNTWTAWKNITMT